MEFACARRIGDGIIIFTKTSCFQPFFKIAENSDAF